MLEVGGSSSGAARRGDLSRGPIRESMRPRRVSAAASRCATHRASRSEALRAAGHDPVPRVCAQPQTVATGAPARFCNAGRASTSIKRSRKSAADHEDVMPLRYGAVVASSTILEVGDRAGEGYFPSAEGDSRTFGNAGKGKTGSVAVRRGKGGPFGVKVWPA